MICLETTRDDSWQQVRAYVQYNNQPSTLGKTPRSLHDCAIPELARVRVGNVLNAWGGDRLLFAPTLARGGNALLLISTFKLLRQCDNGYGIPDRGRHNWHRFLSNETRARRGSSS